MQLSPSPVQLSKWIFTLEENREQASVHTKLDDVKRSWSPEDVEELIASGSAEAQLRHICLTAMLFLHVELYSMLTKLDVSPRELGENEDQWRLFRDEVLAIENPRIAATSLRFFRNGEDCYEHLWKDHIPFLIQLAANEEVCDNVRELGSITRVIWNCSESEHRPGNILALLKGVWQALLDKKTKEVLTSTTIRVGLFNEALKTCATAPFLDENVWTEHAVRNLLIESIENGLAGQINHKNPNKEFLPGAWH
eukprot:TRINITY_DN8738_c0_g1_i2.p1 TRINITY_DN8738_c0_g1~~TRINITY_DN8738_c0_g1_i2.p1  ORF type:complete len:253 (+),score=59.85 TRINITY_DN8738_c0_g1_i2:109-867(+)